MLAKDLIKRLKELGENRLILLNDKGNAYPIEIGHFILWADIEKPDPKDDPICLNLEAIYPKEDEDDEDFEEGSMEHWDNE